MNDATIHLRIAARPRINLARRMKAMRTSVMIDPERALDGLREIAGNHEIGFVDELIRHYESAFHQIEALDPDHLPSTKSVLGIASRPEHTCERLNQQSKFEPAGCS